MGIVEKLNGRLRLLLYAIEISYFLYRVETGLRSMGFQRLRPLVITWHTRPVKLSIRQIVRCINIASNFIPKSACLGRAIALQTLLYRQGRLTTLVVGVAKDADGKVLAHAWLTHQGISFYGIEPEQSVVYSPIMTSEIGDKA